MKTLKTLRPTAGSAALTAGLAATLSAVPMFGASAQQAAPVTDETLPTVTVEDHSDSYSYSYQPGHEPPVEAGPQSRCEFC